MTVATVGALTLTGFLAVRDRQNASAASNDRANATRDAVALAGLQRVSASLELATSMKFAGILGLEKIGLSNFQSTVVTPLGGTLLKRPGEWTLALGGGWACLTWVQTRDQLVGTTVTRGVCSGAPIEATPAVSETALNLAVTAALRKQRAAIDAAYATASILTSGEASNPRFSLYALSQRLDHLAHPGFHVTVTPEGVTIATSTSTACLRTNASDQRVRITLGACS